VAGAVIKAWQTTALAAQQAAQGHPRSVAQTAAGRVGGELAARWTPPASAAHDQLEPEDEELLLLPDQPATQTICHRGSLPGL